MTMNIGITAYYENTAEPERVGIPVGTGVYNICQHVPVEEVPATSIVVASGAISPVIY